MANSLNNKTYQYQYFSRSKSNEEVGGKYEKEKKEISDYTEPPPFHFEGNLSYDSGNKKGQYLQTEDYNTGDGGSRYEVMSSFVRTSQRLQNMVHGYEARVKHASDHIASLQQHVFSLHRELAKKNSVIRQVSDRYIRVCEQKQALEEQLRREIDELSAVGSTRVKDDSAKLEHLLIQQIGKNKSLEYQNEVLKKRVANLLSRKT